MSFLLASASSQHLLANEAPVTAEPLTFSFWYRVASSPTNFMAFGLGRSTGQGAFRINVTGTTMLAQRVDDTGAASTISSTTVANTVGTWYHAAAVFLPSGSNITGYVDGVAGTPATNTGATLSTLDRVVIGARLSGGTAGLFFNGEIAECGIWNAALTAGEILALARRHRPDVVRPQNLVRYDRLIRDLQSLRGGAALTNVNGAIPSPHPAIIYP